MKSDHEEEKISENKEEKMFAVNWDQNYRRYCVGDW